MTLPAITLPKVELPFDIPVLLHPAVDHFAIALPVVIILLEFYSLFARRKTVGGFSFILIVLAVVVFTAAYFTGLVDGKEAYSLLSPEGKEALKAHKLLGIYLLFGSAVLLFFKLLAMTGKGFFKFLFFVVLIGFIAVTLKQGKEGGELVYGHGANVERVKILDDELFDVKEELEELEEESEKTEAPAETVDKEIIEKETAEKETVEKAVEVPTPAAVVEEPTVETETQAAPEVVVPTVATPAQPSVETADIRESIGSAVRESAKIIEEAVVTPSVEEISTPQ